VTVRAIIRELKDQGWFLSRQRGSHRQSHHPTKAGSNLCAYVVGLDGCIATGRTVAEVEENMRDAIEFHLEGMRLHGDQLPSTTPIVRTVHVTS